MAANLGDVSNIYSNGGPQLVNNNIINSNLIINEEKGRNEGLLRQAWISSIQYWQHHDIISQDLLPGSGQWFLKSRRYRTWKDSQKPSILWLHGIPGSGKTNLVACVVNDVDACIDPNRDSDEEMHDASHSPRSNLAYFYCARDTEEERRKPDEIIRSLLGQLAFQRDNPQQLRQQVETIYHKRRKQVKDRRSEKLEKLSVSECEALLLELIQEQRTVIVLDALDEVEPNSRYIFWILSDKSSRSLMSRYTSNCCMYY